MRVLLVEDEKALAKPLKKILEKNNFIVDLVFDGEEGLDYGFSEIYDVIILDIMLPKMDGYQVLKELRKEKIQTPVIMLTALGETFQRVKGLDIGADDYLTKPFEAEELMARLRALYRRKDRELESRFIECGDLKLDTENQIIIKDKDRIDLTLKEFSILEILIRNYPNICSKEILFDKVWGIDSDVYDNNLEVYISFLRKKLDTIDSDVKIGTVRGVGYRLEE